MGFESLWISERKHDPFMQLAVAATATERIKLGPEIALAFPRNPMVLAYQAWDLQNASNGRFILSATHTDQDVDATVDKVEKALVEVRAEGLL